MLNRRSLVVLVVSATMLAGCTGLNNTTQKVDSQQTQATTGTSSPEPKTYTLDDVAKHAAKDDCWMSIEGKVYDVTKITKAATHPGGEVILKGCGTDATKIFNDRPNDNRPHSQQAKQSLKNFYIGELEQ